MLCQNCRKNEATTHIKRIINGTAAEYYLCRDCAEGLGYSAPFMAGAAGLGELLGSFLGDIPVARLSNRVLQCEKCGSTFDDILKNGRVGCADCYLLFYEKLQPSIQRIHGQTVHCGKTPRRGGAAEREKNRLDGLRQQLKRAVEEQNFELAACLRDEIRSMEGTENA